MHRTAYPEGKTRVELNALRHGLKAWSFFSHLAKSRRAREEFNGLYPALYAALLPDETGIDLLWVASPSGLPLEATDRTALQFEAIMSLKISHLRIRGVESHYVIENKGDAR